MMAFLSSLHPMLQKISSLLCAHPRSRTTSSSGVTPVSLPSRSESPLDPSSSPVLLAIYSYRQGQTSRHEIVNKNTFQWEDQAGERTHVIEIWPNPKHPLDMAWASTIVDLGAEKEKVKEKPEGAESPCGPLRLYDCENMVLKTRQAYLEETMGTVPPYVVVSQVWGQIKEFMELPTVPWAVPISEKRKWDAILDFCKEQHVKWIWADIICINQSKSSEAEIEKEEEIPKMNQYYREATACLVVPQYYRIFCSAYACVMEIFSRFVDSSPSVVKDNARQIWDAIGMLERVADDFWFWRVWTYQELLLPRKHVLLDGREFSLDKLERCLGWYYTILRNGILERPEGGRTYEFVDVGQKGIKAKPWRDLRTSWSLRTKFQRDGYLDLLPAVFAVTEKQCAFTVDRMLGVYGLLKDDDKLSTLREPNTDSLTTENISSDGATSASTPSDQLPAHTSPSHQFARLERLWKRTIVKAVTEGRVWPLLYDSMVANAPEGTNWIPRLMTNMGREVRDICNQHNRRRVTVTEAGVELTVRVVGRVNGVSASIGDGTGELNKMIACAWTLVARGFDAQPILQMLQAGLAVSDTVSQGGVKDAQTKLKQALHAPSLVACFFIVEEMDFRQKLLYAGDIAGWHRSVFAAQPGPSYSGADGTYVFLGLIHDVKPADSKQCWILDVTAGSQGAKRWVIANKVGLNTFHKIGSVVANSLPAFTTNDMYASVVLD